MIKDQLRTTPSADAAPHLARAALLPHKCACGGAPGMDGECAECRGTRLQRGADRQPAQGSQPPVASLAPDQRPKSLTAGRGSSGYNFEQIPVHAPPRQDVRTRTFIMDDSDSGTVDPETGIETITSTCCPLHEGESVSSQDKFSVLDGGPLPALGGTQAQYKFEYVGAIDGSGDCSCDCCAFVQFVKGFFEVNGVRRPHTLPGSGNPLSPSTFDQDSPVIPHAACRVATAPGGALLKDTPGFRGIKPTDVLNIHLEFDARTIQTCDASRIAASRLFTLDITGAHPRTFSATGNLG